LKSSFRYLKLRNAGNGDCHRDTVKLSSQCHDDDMWTGGDS